MDNYNYYIKIFCFLVNDKRVQLKPTKIPGSNYINASLINVSTKNLFYVMCVITICIPIMQHIATYINQMIHNFSSRLYS